MGVLSDDIKNRIRAYIPRYPSKRAVTLPALHLVHEHLREHAVPLDKRAIAHLSGNSLGLDLYALLAYRLPRLKQPVHLRWAALQEQIGSEESAMKEAR